MARKPKSPTIPELQKSIREGALRRPERPEWEPLVDEGLYTRPVKAYHQISGGRPALEQVFDQGAILPLVSRTDPDEVRILCEKQISHMRMSRFHKKALQEILEDELSKMEKGSGWMAEGSHLWCTDVIAGDARNVFLSPFDWVAIPEEGLTGLVFDAEELILMGAGYRKHDFMYVWEDAITSVLKFRAESVGQAREKFRRSLREAKETAKEIEVHGGAALRSLEEARTDLLSGKGYQETDAGEIVWAGPLQANLAIEVWLDGVPVE